MAFNDYGYQDLISNPTPRVPVVLCLDTSGSMLGAPINELNRGVQQFYQELMNDEVARYAAEISIVTFGGSVHCVQDFGDITRQTVSPMSAAMGHTPMGEALIMALDRLESRKQQYKDAGVDYFQPWLVIMTDGQPNGDQEILSNAIARISSMVASKKLTVFPIAIGDEADTHILKKISSKPAMHLKGLKFVEFFQWLSRSVAYMSQSMPGEVIKLPKANIEDWLAL